MLNFAAFVPCVPVATATMPGHKGDGLKHDPQEDDPRLRKAFEEADAYAQRKTANDPPRLGEIHECWHYKKEYLLRKYGIHWRDPQDMNPTIAID